MYGPNVTNALSLTKVLGGVSKILGIANQAIPLYKEIKPMVSNARKIMGVLKEFQNIPNYPVSNKTIKTINAISKEKIVKNNSLQSNPVFFQ